MSKQAETDRSKALKEKDELEKFIARFSANASKAKQATSRQKQLDKLDISEIKLSSRRDPSIMFMPHREIGNEVLEVKDLCKSYGEEKLKIVPRTNGSSTGSSHEISNSYLEDNSWRDEINEFADAILQHERIENGNSEDALKVMKMVFQRCSTQASTRPRKRR